MKDEFLGFYEPTSKEINDSWKEGTFIFDANALLNLYRYSEATRKDFLLVLDKLKEKLFMPYQVGFEYHNNRINVIESLANSYSTLYTIINELFEKQVANQLNQFKRHPSIKLESFLIIQKEFLKKISAELDNQKKTHPDFMSKDNILDHLTELYIRKVGKPFTKDELRKIYSEGKDRYDQSIPPGYKDLETKKKKGDQHLYGDLIIWKEIINYAQKEKKPIIFITDDRKEDWWTIDNGKTIRPREELIKEFYDLTGIRILIYTADSFLHFSKERKLVTEIKETSIDEIKEVRISDEEFDVFRGKTWQDLLGQQNANSLADVISSGNYYKTYKELLPSYTPSLADIAKVTNLQDVLKPYTTLSDGANTKGFLEALKPYATLSDIVNTKFLEALKPYTILSDVANTKGFIEALKPYKSLSDIGNIISQQETIKPEITLKKSTKTDTNSTTSQNKQNNKDLNRSVIKQRVKASENTSELSKPIKKYKK